MSRNGKFEYSDLKKLKKNLENLANKEVSSFFEACAKELVARLLAIVIPRTPVGQYSSGSGKVGGTLRRGWTAGKDTNAKEYADSLKIKYSGKNYIIEITNPVEYSSYVEFGHRTKNHKGWVPGMFMLTISEQEIQTVAPKLLEKRVKQFMEECFNAE